MFWVLNMSYQPAGPTRTSRRAVWGRGFGRVVCVCVCGGGGGYALGNHMWDTTMLVTKRERGPSFATPPTNMHRGYVGSIVPAVHTAVSGRPKGSLPFIGLDNRSVLGLVDARQPACTMKAHMSVVRESKGEGCGVRGEG